ncbi:hypothetical protein VitviT2T_020703 [Vitis vinifera]|uniref:RING-type E3 ubiquitin transferase n=3 Tax=Vitis vinifera TaxID=29760 RepID=A0ABY9D4U8_VITVI|nr:E3 ubiquitin-protein ligase RING1-like [Vitis vinifera]WKA02527.1 hypothetical protein VitviT2T_020703 [Vitis vinifera]|eukprot:XP_002271062.1 PREDICTED: E3 ubiquitin-protein ligase RING1-like [Vitis vinifera]
MSATAATTPTTPTAATAIDRRTYWCHECDMSVTLSPSSSSSPTLLCPHCHSDFLEEMDSPNPNPNPNPTAPNFSFHSENFLLDSPYLHRLIHHLTHPSDTNNDGNDSSDLPPPRYLNPNSVAASRASLEALPTFKITPSFLQLDPILFCAVCKDQFVVDVEAKRLPCNHIYHSDCILPWLSQQNSCPLCRFRLPTDEGEDSGDAGATVTMTFGDLMEDHELFGLGSTLRHIARRNRLVFPALSAEGQAQAQGESLGPDNSVETVSSWPRQVLVGGGGGGGGDADFGAGAVANEDADAMMPEVRVSGSVSASS